MRMFCVRFTACLALAAAFAFGWMTEGRAGETAPPPAAKTPSRPAAKQSASSAKTPEEVAAGISKQLTAIQEQITALQTEEFQITTKVLPAIENARKAGKIEDPAKAREEMGKGNVKPEWKEYTQVYLASAQQWQALAEKYVRMRDRLKALEPNRDKASPDGQAMIDTLVKRVTDKCRALIERAGDAFNQVGEYKKALAIFVSVYREVPEDKRASEKILTTKLADVLYLTGDFKAAFPLYEGMYKAASEAERKTWSTFETRRRLATLNEKAGDYKAALELWKSVLETIEPAKRNEDWVKTSIKDRITACEEKLKTAPATPTGPKGAAAKRPGR